MNKFVRNLLTEWRKLELPFENETIILAVSGGADSVSLTLALSDLKKRKKLDLKFIIAHFDHDLRGIESRKDAEFVEQLAEKLDFAFVSEKGNLTKKGNLEQNARQARYDFLVQTAEQYDSYAILTAHTKNDQAETLLFNLIRGSGLDGLAGMKAIQSLKKDPENQKSILLVRPLLNWAGRLETVKYCLDCEIQFRQDEMNDDLKFSRVKIRKEIIPMLEKINPRLIDTLSQTANLLRNEAENLKINPIKLPEELSQNEISKLPKSMRNRTLRAWLELKRGSLRQLGMKHFVAIEHLLISKKSGRIVELPNGERVLKKDGKIYFEKSAVEKSRSDN